MVKPQYNFVAGEMADDKSQAPAKRGRGRPKGSAKPKPADVSRKTKSRGIACVANIDVCNALALAI